jgi:metal-responsive CopG/Arc/MetJ family transcriptional regulator
MVVISISLPAKDLKAFDGISAEMKYPSRSDAVRDAIHKFVQDHAWCHATEHRSHFLLSLVYPEGSKHAVLDVLHRYGAAIHSSAHTHFDSTCADQLVLVGGPEVGDFVKELTAIRDVRLCNCVV